MNKLQFLPLLLLLACTDETPEPPPPAAITLQQSTELDTRLREISGLAWTGTELYAQNDSGNDPKIYRLDPETSSVLGSFELDLPNRDWEDLAVDDSYLYIGDFGNNLGNRTDLSIFRIALVEIAQPDATVDTLHFSFALQAQPPLPSSDHNFDVEGFYVQQDSIQLFSKNRSGDGSQRYVFSAAPGEYLLLPRATLDLPGTVTGADRLPTGEVALCGYRFENNAFTPFIRYYPEGLNGPHLQFTDLPPVQMESIVLLNATTILTASEGEGSAEPTLFRLEVL